MRYLTMDELVAGLAALPAAPRDGGRLEAIVIRPEADQRQQLDRCRLTAAEGVPGDRWSRQCWLKLPDGRSHPDVQITLMNAPVIQLIAGSRERWELAGDNLYVDFDLSRDSLPAGQRLRLGESVLEITDHPHTGCRKFIQRYGADAMAFVNSADGMARRLRGVYARVVQDGEIAVGDTLQRV